MGEESGVTSHNLYEEYALMALSRVAYAVDTLHDGVHRGVVSYCRVGTVQVVVDGSRQTDTADVVFRCEYLRSGERAVAAYDHKRVYLFLLHRLVGFEHAFGSGELLAAGRLQYCSALHDYTADIFCSKRLYLAVDKSFVPTVDTLDIKSVADSGTCHGTYCSVHSRSITAGSKYTYCLDFSHNKFCYILM